jgi:hypothetical protein
MRDYYNEIVKDLNEFLVIGGVAKYIYMQQYVYDNLINRYYGMGMFSNPIDVANSICGLSIRVSADMHCDYLITGKELKEETK